MMTTFEAVEKLIDGAMGKYNSDTWVEVESKKLELGMLFKISKELDAATFRYDGIDDYGRFKIINTYTNKPVENIAYRPNKIVLVREKNL